MAHRSEQGNVLGFVLVGALLVALLLGGIYVVRQNAPGQAGTNVATNDTSSQGGEHSNSDSNANNTDNTSSDESKKSDEQSLKEALEKQSNQNKDASTTNTDNANKNSTKDNSAQTTTLPQTGPADAFIGMAGATLLAGAGVSYARSRRLL